MLKFLKTTDPEVANWIQREIERQKNGLEMIASENYASEAVIEALGTPLTNKYSEGYPSRRYYGGNEFIDQIEQLAIERAKTLFGSEHANVQPHAGAQANMAAYFALTSPGDTILAMSLKAGGHLTHGAPFNFSGKFYRFVHYGVRKDTELIDMDEVSYLAHKEKPKVILAGFTAYPRHLDFATFHSIAQEVGAYLLVDMAHFAGLVAAKVHPDPVPFADVVTSTTHKTLRGPRGAIILSKIHDTLRPEKTLAERIDAAVFPGIQGGPLDHVIAAKAVCFHEAKQQSFVTYQKQVLKNAQALKCALEEEGFRIITGGTDNHLVLVDLTPIGIFGREAERILDSVGIYTNKNLIPFDERGPQDPSGLRIGTPAITTRGLKEDEVKEIGKMIASVIKNPTETQREKTAKFVQEIVKTYPIYHENT